MKIAIIGKGKVGNALGTGWTAAGHEVLYGVREPTTEDPLSLSPAEASIAAELIALTVPWSAVAETLGTISRYLSGKVLVDCTNPTRGWPAVDHSEGSGGEQVARLAPHARVVKCFNTTGYENMHDPVYQGAAATMFYAGDDANAKSHVHRLAADLGFDPVDAGGLAQSHALEVLASFWGNLAYGQKMSRGIAFRLMRRTI